MVFNYNLKFINRLLLLLFSILNTIVYVYYKLGVQRTRRSGILVRKQTRLSFVTNKCVLNRFKNHIILRKSKKMNILRAYFKCRARANAFEVVVFKTRNEFSRDNQ